MISVAIIGTGNISKSHVRGYLAFPDRCQIVALYDIYPDKARALAEEFGLEVRVYDSHTALLEAESGRIDMVDVCTSPASHAQVTIDALRAGVNVLVEKPMAPSLEECDAMIAAARESGKKLGVVAQNRFRDDMATLKEAIDSGLAGDLTHVEVSSSWWRGKSYYDLWWRGTWASEGGGATLSQAIHHLDLTLWLAGMPQKVTSVLANTAHDNSEVEDLSVSILSYPRGLAVISASVVDHGEEQSIVVQGTKARVSQPWRVVAYTPQPNGFPLPGGNPDLVRELDDLASRHVPLAHVGHEGQIGDFLDALESGRPPAVTGEDGRAAMELATAIYESGIEKRTVDFPLSADDPYYQAGQLACRAPHFFEKTASVEDQGGFITVPSSPAPTHEGNDH
ncbi:MAG: Gfo/Idh/MocA family oxidoreductase [Propionibacteriaceae bacterium]|jgi:predicted dehydrogenase|nr:Gfo/Idh/MocA family oxidoreductase [Propionibacteriaceae bacterium]